MKRLDDLNASNVRKSKYVPVSLTEEFILNYDALPKQLAGFRRYRIEYNGHAEACVKEQTIYLPRNADSFIFDLLFDFWQTKGAKQRKVLNEITSELQRGLR